MVLARSCRDIRRARWAIERIARLSDSIVAIGPFGIGLDGLLAWIPFVGDAYSVAAGVLLVLLGVRVRAPGTTLAAVAALVGLRSVADLVPVVGPAMVDLFRGHRLAAGLLLEMIDKTLYIEAAEGPSHPEYADGDHRRVVFLG